MLTERQCPFPSCGRLYTKKLNHVKLFHQNEAYEFFIDRHISKGLRGGGLCHVCKIAFSDKPEDHVDIKHKDRPFKELAKEKFE